MNHIGIDMVDNDRISLMAKKYHHRFVDRILTNDEKMNYKISQLPSIWATKEAVSKALGCGIGKEFGFHDVSLMKDSRGKPFLKFSSMIQKKFGILDTSVSITHDKGLTIAVVALLTTTDKMQ